MLPSVSDEILGCVGLGEARRVWGRAVAILWLHLDIAATGADRQGQEERQHADHLFSFAFGAYVASPTFDLSGRSP